MEIIPDKVFKDLFSKTPEGKGKYIPVTSDSSLYDKLFSFGYMPMFVADKSDMEKYSLIIYDDLASGGNVKEYIFLPIMLKKGVSNDFGDWLADFDIRFDRQAWSMFPKGFDVSTVKDKTVIERFINKYIEKLEKAEKSGKSDYSLDMTTMDKATEKHAEWLILDYVPKNQITTLAGDGGSGKTTFWCSMAAAVSNGKYWFLSEDIYPFEEENPVPQKVMFFSAEDSYEYTLKRRLRKNGANLENIMSIDIADDRFKDIKFNSPFLEQLIAKYRPALVIFDPIQAFVPPDIRMGDRNAMRSCLAPLIAYGEKYGCTVLIVVHSNKQSGVWGRKRIADSADIWDISRSVLMVGETNEKGVRYLSHEKCNYGMTSETVLFTLDDEIVEIKGKTTKKDKDYVTEVNYDTKQAPQREGAKDFILDFLKDGEKEVSELDSMAKAMSISGHTLERAKADLKKEHKLKYRSEGYGKNKKYYCFLIPSEKKEE